jgi:fengycin family lipopeptide synthetase D
MVADDLPGLERKIAAFIEQSLDVTGLLPTESLFDRGATSLTAVSLVFHLQDKFGALIELIEVFDHPSVRELAELVHQRQSA